jgi:hypothetical protein
MILGAPWSSAWSGTTVASLATGAAHEHGFGGPSISRTRLLESRGRRPSQPSREGGLGVVVDQQGAAGG